MHATRLDEGDDAPYTTGNEAENDGNDTAGDFAEIEILYAKTAEENGKESGSGFILNRLSAIHGRMGRTGSAGWRAGCDGRSADWAGVVIGGPGRTESLHQFGIRIDRTPFGFAISPDESVGSDVIRLHLFGRHRTDLLGVEYDIPVFVHRKDDDMIG